MEITSLVSTTVDEREGLTQFITVRKKRAGRLVTLSFLDILATKLDVVSFCSSFPNRLGVNSFT